MLGAGTESPKERDREAARRLSEANRSGPLANEATLKRQ